MCGRFTLSTPPQLLAQRFGLADVPELAPRYNIAPTQPVAVVRLRRSGRTEAATLRWGLVPSWADSPSTSRPLVNARIETVAEKPSFRDSFRSRRCLVLADGFFEWKTVAAKKQPYLFRLADGGPFALAGLWDRWVSPAGETVESCTVLTTDANALVRPFHDRMPVIVTPEDAEVWLTSPFRDPMQLQPFYRPYRSEAMRAYPVNAAVGNPRNETPHCIEPLAG